MDLSRNWDWNERKLPVRVKPESGNPAADELRLRLREIAQRLAVETLKAEDITGGDNKKVSERTLTNIKLDTDESVAMTLKDSTFNVPALIGHVSSGPLTKTIMNVNKRFFRVPKSPPRKVMMDLQKSRLIRDAGDFHHAHHHDDEKATAKAGGTGSRIRGMQRKSKAKVS